jgi:hypothetical protein
MTTSDLTCREFVELVTGYLERALPARELIRAEQHLVVCSGCTRYHDQMLATISVAGTVELAELGAESRRALLGTIEDWLARQE